ncbi:MAG: hypothetical protein E7163_05010 [Firmicutes bacterium]|nr:hypothetical protein [Bacillota bacterium]
MGNKKKLLILVGVLLLGVGISFAFFAIQAIFEGEGSKIDTQTALIGNATIEVTGSIDLNESETETGVLPGHKSISKIKVTADNNGYASDFDVGFKLVWNGINPLATDLKFTIYKTTDADAVINKTCTRKTKTAGKYIYYSEECELTSDKIDLNSPLVEDGTIAGNSTVSTKEILLPEEVMTATNNPEANAVYYYIVIEFPNTTVNQNADMTVGSDLKSFSGVIKAEKVIDDATGSEYILANTPLQTDDPDFSKTSCTKGTNEGGDCGEETVGLYKCIIKEDGECAKQEELSSLDTTNLKTTYYYRGDVNDNYVKFAGFYWRIIRINENGSIRMIYQGRTKDENGNELEIQNFGDETQLAETSSFNTDYNRAEYVGFKYELENAHGTDDKSTILSALETWYAKEDNELQNYEEYLDTESGFCGDRTSYTDYSGITAGGGTGTTTTYYGAYIRNVTNKAPSFKCSDNENDLYKTKIGLITADEVAYAGGVDGVNNYSYYLYTCTWYWTLSPGLFNGTIAYVFGVYWDGFLGDDNLVDDPDGGVRPVINLRADNLIISGSGTETDPYVIS